MDNTTESLTQDGIEAIAADILTGSAEDSLDQSKPDVALDIANEVLGVDDESPDQEPEAEEEHQVSDENETEESDDESPVEAEADEVDDNEPTDNNAEAFYVDYDEVKDASLPIKINGEVKYMKFGEIQNQLARAESASKKSQEANQRQEELDAKEAQLNEQEGWFKKRSESAQMSNELATRINQIRGMEQALHKAVEKNDSHNAALLREKINQASRGAQQLQQQVNVVNQEAQQRHYNTQYKLLQDKGFGNILNDNYIEYVNTNVSEEAKYAIDNDATLAILAEKARKWDASQGKAKRTLKKSKSLPAGGGKINQSKSNASQAKMAKMRAGQGSQDDALSAVHDIANEILFGKS